MSHTARIPFFTLAPEIRKAMVNLSMSVHGSSLGAHLVELVQLRVSQINGCGICIDMHWRALMQQGMEPRHINGVAGWREAPFFSERERAALGWAEAVNALPQQDGTDVAFRPLREHFSDGEIAELCYCVAAIKGWNMINLSLRNQIPEVPPPGM